jgi:hypothetical protein
MRTRQTRDLPARLEGVRQRFERWRGTHRARSRIPDLLWTAAVKMAQRHGIHRTSRTLRLDYYSLKKRLEEESAVSSPASPREPVTTFLELASSANRVFASATTADHLPVAPARCAAGPCECTLEVEDTEGAKMRVHLKGIEAPDLVALSRSFWNPVP